MVYVSYSNNNPKISLAEQNEGLFLTNTDIIGVLLGFSWDSHRLPHHCHQRWYYGWFT